MIKVTGQRSYNSFGNTVLACISESNGPVGLNFGMVVYYHEWIIFCSVSVHKKVKVIGHRSHESLKNHVLACISVIYGTIGMDFGIVVYIHQWIIFCS